MKHFVFAALSSLAIAILTACGGLSAEDACKKVESLCSSNTKGDGGVTGSVSMSCDANGLDKASNSSDVKTCIDKANDCKAAFDCMLTAKP